LVVAQCPIDGEDVGKYVGLCVAAGSARIGANTLKLNVSQTPPPRHMPLTQSLVMSQVFPGATCQFPVQLHMQIPSRQEASVGDGDDDGIIIVER
jgi:hypothetical protein